MRAIIETRLAAALNCEAASGLIELRLCNERRLMVIWRSFNSRWSDSAFNSSCLWINSSF
jgi:uncharacterized protein